MTVPAKVLDDGLRLLRHWAAMLAVTAVMVAVLVVLLTFGPPRDLAAYGAGVVLVLDGMALAWIVHRHDVGLPILPWSRGVDEPKCLDGAR